MTRAADLNAAGSYAETQAPNGLSGGGPTPGRGEIIAIIALLMLYSQALLAQLAPADGTENPALRLIWPPVYLVVIGFAIASGRDVARAIRSTPLIALLTLFVVASTFWSIDPGVTFRRSIAVVMTTMFGWLLAARYSWLWMLRLYGIAWLILAVLSFLVSLAVPSIGVMSEVHVGAWRGLWSEKNAMGGDMARSSLLFAVLAMGDKRWRRTWIAAFVLAVALVFLSTSKTSLLGTVLSLGIILLGLLVRRSPRSALLSVWIAGTGVTCLVMALVFAPDLIFGALGRDATLTGRTEIWGALGEAIAERPWLGYGYGVFWLPYSEPGNILRAKVFWDAPSAHNGWLEIWVALGPIALGLFVLSYLSSLSRALLTLATSWGGLYAVGYLAQYTLFSVSESIILKQNSLLWVAFVAVAAKLAMQVREPGRFRPPAAALMKMRDAPPPLHKA